MEILLLKTKIAHSRRIFGQLSEYKTKLTTADLENGFNLFKNI